QEDARALRPHAGRAALAGPPAFRAASAVACHAMSAYSARPDGTLRRRSDGRRSGEPVRLDTLADAPVPPKVVRHTGTFLYEDQHTLSARSACPSTCSVVDATGSAYREPGGGRHGVFPDRVASLDGRSDRARCRGVGMRFSGSHLSRFQRLRRVVAAPLALLLATSLAGLSRVADASVLPSGFQDTVVLSGMTNPTVVQFAPDGRIFVGQKNGVIKV